LVILLLLSIISCFLPWITAKVIIGGEDRSTTNYGNQYIIPLGARYTVPVAILSVIGFILLAYSFKATQRIHMLRVIAGILILIGAIAAFAYTFSAAIAEATGALRYSISVWPEYGMGLEALFGLLMLIVGAWGARPMISLKRSRIPYIFLIPFFLNVAIFSAFPLGFGLYMSFTDWNPFMSITEARFVGFANYVRALTNDPVYLLSIKNAFVYVLYEPICILIGFFFAIVLNTAIKGRSLFRTIFFIPVITSTVAIAIVWNWLYDYDRGPFNYFLRSLHLTPQHWLSQIQVLPGVPQALTSVMLMSIWQYIGLNVVIFLAALQSIPKEYHEAASVSGANAWNRFRHVTLPLVRPAVLFCAITATAGSLQVFTEIFMMTRGGPVQSTMVPVLWMYNKAFGGSSPQFGYGAALSYTFFAIILAISLVEIRILRRGGMVYY